MRSHLNAKGDSLPAASRRDHRLSSLRHWRRVKWQSLGVGPRSCLAPFARCNEENLFGWTGLDVLAVSNEELSPEGQL